MRHLSKRGLAALIMCVTVVTSSLIFIFDSNGVEATGVRSASVYPGLSLTSQQSLQIGQNDGNAIDIAMNSGVPGKFVYLPNIYAQNLGQQGVSPLYSRGPAPMGLTDYGFMEPSGLKIPYTYQTSSFLGTVMFEDLNAQYLMNSNPDTVAAQLSAVLTVSSGQGNHTDYFWVKNIMLYTPSTGEAQFISNIWDLSSASLALPNGIIESGNGSLIPGIMYYYAGPVIQMVEENTVGLYINSVEINGHDAVVFQYSSGTGEHGEVPAGTTFDTVILSTSTYEQTGSDAKFVVDGFSKTPSGLLKDVELAITGPGMGSTSSIYSANGQLTLKFLGPDGTYTKLPAAYNYGSNTGETIQGLSVWWSSQMKPMAHLSTGPSLLVSMWGSQVSHSGAVNLQGKIDPPNSFVFISMGTKFDNNTASWAPINENGTYKFSLPGRISYTIEVMASNFEPQYVTIATATNESEEEGTGEPHGGGGGGEGADTTLAWTNFTLDFNGARGVYTPLYANGNEQLVNLTQGRSSNGTPVGNGTLADPYLLENNQYVRINELFTRTNNFLYPQFSGILIQNTNKTVRVDSPPSFQYKYPVDQYMLLNSMGLPYFNNLNMIFQNTSGVILSNATSITGWFPNTILQENIANVMIIDSSDFLVASNTFRSMGTSLSIYSGNSGSDNITVWGNTFVRDVLMDSSYSAALMHGTNPLAVSLFSSGNLIYNNYFGQQTTVRSPLHDPYTMEPTMYWNSWNLPDKMGLSFTNTVNGIGLNGSIVECGYQGGNYWEDQNVDQVPYNVNGEIAYGGDFIPLHPPAFEISFNALGDVPPSGWYVQFDKKPMNHFMGPHGSGKLLNGTHEYRVITPSSYSASPSQGTIGVNGLAHTVNITFTKVTYPVTFTRSGITDGSDWTLSVGGMVKETSDNSVTLYLQNGSYQYSATVNAKHQFAHSSGKVLVLGKSVNQAIAFNNRLHVVSFVLNQEQFQGQWSIMVNGTSYSSSTASILSDLQNGVYQYNVTAPEGYVVTPSSGTFAVLDGNVTLSLDVKTQTYKITFVGNGLESGTQWQVKFGNETIHSTQSEITFEVPVGNYTYFVPDVSTYTTDQANGYVIISDQNMTINIEFQPPVNYSEDGVAVLIGTVAFGTVTALAIYLVDRKK